MIKEIGGFFELEINFKKEYHSNAVKLNNARSCLNYIFKGRGYKKIYIPYYICHCVLQPIEKNNMEYEFYHIDENFNPLLKKSIKKDECMLYVNYFDICAEKIDYLGKKFSNLIIDNTQAFFRRPVSNVDTLYSPRKFFGVSDGGYLYTSATYDKTLKRDESYERYKHLLKRLDTSAQESYHLFKENEKLLDTLELKKMSKLTEKILMGIDYEYAINKRNENFAYLHENLCKNNNLNISLDNINGPMVYPLLVEDNTLRNKLINNKIYVPTYWEEVKNRVSKSTFEYLCSNNLIPLPIDQRYGLKEMKYIIDKVKR